MSETETTSNKPVDNNGLHKETSDSNSKEKSNSIPYFERIRQYYDRRMPSRNRPTQPNHVTNPDVEVIPRNKPETEEVDDTTETVNTPYPGVDDGFFTNGNSNPDSENIPLVPNNPGSGRTNPPEGEDKPGRNPNDEGNDVPDVGRPTHVPGGQFPKTPEYGPQWPSYYPGEKPSYPGIRPDVEGGIAEPLPDINVYQHKKTLAQGMMDLALFSANANQLRYVLESYERHPYYYPSLILISLSIIFQVAVGIGLIMNAHYNVKDDREVCIANKINNYTVLGIFLITVINVFISAFGVANITDVTTP